MVRRRHLFDPFYSGREAGRGLGFGLSKVWTIAKLHGGSVEFDDQVKSGTRFVLRLPQNRTIVSQRTSALEIELGALPTSGDKSEAADVNGSNSGLDEDAA